MAKFFVACIFAALLVSQAAAESHPDAASLISGHSDFSILASALKKAALADKLGKDFSGTVFAPTNAAFAEFVAVLKAHRRNETHETVPVAVLALMLSDHVTEESLTMPLENGKTIKTLRGKELTVSTELGVTTMIGSGVVTTLTSAPHKAGKATIIPIDSVLQYVNHASDDEAPDASRRLMSARTLMCSCGGMSGCCHSHCSCCTGCSKLFCNC